jgi:hypothetical protein
VACVLLLAVFHTSRALIGVRPPGAPCSGALVTPGRPTRSPAWGAQRHRPRGDLRVALRGGSGGDAGDPSWDNKDPAGTTAPGADGGGGTFDPHTFKARCLAAGVGGIEGTAEKFTKVSALEKFIYKLTSEYFCKSVPGRLIRAHVSRSIQYTTHG